VVYATWGKEISKVGRAVIRNNHPANTEVMAPANAKPVERGGCIGVTWAFLEQMLMEESLDFC